MHLVRVGEGNMDDALYFLTILAPALQQPDLQRSLEEAFAEIKRIGAQERYGEGFSNFRRFMDIACSYADMVDLDAARELIAEIATGALEGKEPEAELLEIIASHPAWQADYEQMRAEQAGPARAGESVPVIGVFGPAGKAGEMVFERIPGRASLAGILPGLCVLKLLNTGWVLWRAELTRQDLIWTAAYGARDLKLAAQTAGARRRPTRRWVLPERHLILRTFAGIEQGTIELELTR